MTMATTRVAAMVVAAAVFFSTFYSVSPQAEAPTPSALGKAPAPSSGLGEGAPAPSVLGEGAPAPSSGLGEGAPAPSALAGCMDKLLNLSDCLTYVLNGSNLTKPDKGCCPELAGLVESNAICLCVLLGTNVSESTGIAIDVKRALKLPSVCDVKTPPASTCSELGIPIGAPTASEGPLSPEGAVGAPSLSPGNNNSEASSIAGSALPITFGIAIAFLPTFF
ncbi:non-specific lipid transfer protein GPI-anchored 2-like [Alnus glutinosa]|uniref:non-specific lipid transfer protein GPI-anchored 2-like n=1 Tax=Alnus glutinosa TaxID=3517 RepID=UPI002D7704B1|nr:non-specific lipid transfer protein GPI-anchored 2-like [Alnus glutinosa]